MQKFTVVDLYKTSFGIHDRPLFLHVDGLDIPVDNWTHLCQVFVRWLIQKGHLRPEKVPVPNHANRGKYFINTKPQHKTQEKDGLWQSVEPFHIDTKYNADSHVRNILYTLRHLGLMNLNLCITITSR
jgi:hypothetical protein